MQAAQSGSSPLVAPRHSAAADSEDTSAVEAALVSLAGPAPLDHATCSDGLQYGSTVDWQPAVHTAVAETHASKEADECWNSDSGSECGAIGTTAARSWAQVEIDMFSWAHASRNALRCVPRSGRRGSAVDADVAAAMGLPAAAVLEPYTRCVARCERRGRSDHKCMMQRNAAACCSCSATLLHVAVQHSYRRQYAAPMTLHYYGVCNAGGCCAHTSRRSLSYLKQCPQQRSHLWHAVLVLAHTMPAFTVPEPASPQKSSAGSRRSRTRHALSAPPVRRRHAAMAPRPCARNISTLPAAALPAVPPPRWSASAARALSAPPRRRSRRRRCNCGQPACACGKSPRPPVDHPW